MFQIKGVSWLALSILLLAGVCAGIVMGGMQGKVAEAAPPPVTGAADTQDAGD